MQQTHMQETQEQASRLQQAQARAAELQRQVEELRGEVAASAAASSRAADAELEAQLREAKRRVAELESKVRGPTQLPASDIAKASELSCLHRWGAHQTRMLR